MAYTMEEKYELIKKEVAKYTSKNPIEIIKSIMKKDYINIHGPEHHFLDGASFLMAYKNAGGMMDIDNALDKLAERSIKMPGAICGYWGVCGSSTSLGAALAIIHETGPLSNNEFYKHNMEFTSKVTAIMAKIGGPRCCKRNAFISISNAVMVGMESYERKVKRKSKEQLRKVANSRYETKTNLKKSNCSQKSLKKEVIKKIKNAHI